MTAFRTFERSPGVTSEVVDGRAILLDPDGTEIVTLNPVGSLVWAELDARRSPDQVADVLLSSFEGVSPDELRRDVADFLHELVVSGLVVEHPPTP